MTRTATRERAAIGGWVARLVRVQDGRAPVLGITAAEGGSSPPFASFASCQAVFDGVLHNRAELARDAGADLPSDANDADVILRAYLRLGESVLDAMRGPFALVIWDGRRDQLVCARDQLGINPLFYVDEGDNLILSTSVDALLSEPGVSGTVNLVVLVDHLRHRWLKPEETFFESVRRVPPGHALVSNRGGRRVFRYWDPAPRDGLIDWIRPDELERFQSLLDQAVDRCLAVGRAGIFLSGGLDSVSVAAAAAENCRARGLAVPLALSLVFPDPDCNEEDVQRRVAAALGLSQILLPFDEAVGPSGLLLAALEVNRTLATPLINLWSPGYDRLALEGKSQGCEVVITGSGGDEWVAVSPYYAADLIRTLDLVGLYRLLGTYRRSYPVSVGRNAWNVLWVFGGRPVAKMAAQRVVPGALRKRKRRHVVASIPSWLAPDGELRSQIAERELEAYASTLGSGRWTPWTYPSTYFEEVRTALAHPLVSMEFEEVFEQGRRVGLRLLHPFLDVDLVEFLYRTPPKLLIRGGRAKSPLRETLARRLPELGLERQRKVVATEFLRTVLMREGRRAWDETGGTPALAEIGLVDADGVEAVVTRLLQGESLRELARIWDLLSSESWLRARR
jgi:asparagine synthase (glutamine-hydrolysing)